MLLLKRQNDCQDGWVKITDMPLFPYFISFYFLSRQTWYFINFNFILVLSFTFSFHLYVFVDLFVNSHLHDNWNLLPHRFFTINISWLMFNNYILFFLVLLRNELFSYISTSYFTFHIYKISCFIFKSIFFDFILCFRCHIWRRDVTLNWFERSQPELNKLTVSALIFIN